MSKIVKGKLGEDLAVKYLQDIGYTVIERNWRYSRLGEIDIIAKNNNQLVFIEVKTRTSAFFGEPIEAITPSKIKKIYKLAEVYLSENTLPNDLGCRFDAVSVILRKTPEIIHHEDIYCG
ncbi:MAG: YraN family protein [bacterium]